MPHQSGILISSVILTILNAYNVKEPDSCWGTFVSDQVLQACYITWNGNLSERRTKARLIIMYRIVKCEIAIPIDTDDIQPGRRGRFSQHTHCYQQYKNSFYLRTISYYYYHVLRVIVSQLSAASSASCKRSRPPSNLVDGQELTMCDIVWISPQSHSSLSVKPYFLWHTLQWPWPVRKRFSSDHWRLWRSKPGSRIVGSTTKVELTTIADCQSFLHRLVTSIVCKCFHSGLRDSRWSGGRWKTSSYNGQSRWHSACDCDWTLLPSKLKDSATLDSFKNRIPVYCY